MIWILGTHYPTQDSLGLRDVSSVSIERQNSELGSTKNSRQNESVLCQPQLMRLEVSILSLAQTSTCRVWLRNVLGLRMYTNSPSDYRWKILGDARHIAGCCK